VVVFGAGTAGVGVADFICSAMVRDGLAPEEARRRIWCLGHNGLLVDGMASGMRDFQRTYARAAEEVRDWHREGEAIELLEVVRRVEPTALIGCAGQPRAFTEAVVRAMAGHTARPIIFALSNPTSLSEMLPSDVIAWSSGRALIATGSPFPPVVHDGTTYVIGQANNAFVFPGLGLGTIVARARTVSDGMLLAAADCVAEMVDAAAPGASVMPAIDDVRELSVRVASGVARVAVEEGIARRDDLDIPTDVRRAMWEPEYREVRALSPPVSP
jgi:malate dehydrogenase (oxaloacetate-decarboxylating)